MVYLFPIFGVLLLLGLFLMSFYNSVIKLRLKVDEAASDIETFLKKRFDLIPNLVNTVKGYMKHEEKTFTKIAELRSAFQNASSPKEMNEVDNALTGTLKTLFAVAENYPELKANENFIDLQEQLQSLESEIQKSRRYYNGTVREFNGKIQTFPGNLFASIFAFKSREFFEASEEEQQNVKVDFEA